MRKSDDKEFIKYCIKHYNQPYFSKEEFSSDLNKTTSIKKSIRRYYDQGVINERLLLNNIITLINTFGIEAANVILFYKMPEEFYPVIKAVLLYLNALKENAFTIGIKPDKDIVRILEDL